MKDAVWHGSIALIAKSQTCGASHITKIGLKIFVQASLPRAPQQKNLGALYARSAGKNGIFVLWRTCAAGRFLSIIQLQSALAPVLAGYFYQEGRTWLLVLGLDSVSKGWRSYACTSFTVIQSNAQPSQNTGPHHASTQLLDVGQLSLCKTAKTGI